jgi:hypothetical protein
MINAQYKMLLAESSEGLTKKMNDHHKKGWKLHGSPFLGVEKGRPVYVQCVFQLKL